jgi:hypothetical protein
MKFIKTFESFNIEIYEHGRCELFTLALHKELGFDMYFYLDKEAEFEDESGEIFYDTALIHAYVKDKNNNLIDATGKIEEEDLDEHAEWVSNGESIVVNQSKFDSLVDKGFISPYTKTELSDCQEYIKSNIEKYVLYTSDKINFYL